MSARTFGCRRTGPAAAVARDILLPITKGLQESIHAFREIDDEIDLKPILAQLTKWPPLDVTLAEETESRLPEVVGGLSVALARTFKVIDPDVKNPQTTHWEDAFHIFSLLL
ncbi:DUF1931 family protein [Kribbella sp. NPDC000426]|uniref:DUF1931 family protein n=1 Tax=Kribbella sp. NPDC000426 TaxID=3154255 RepID=UPI003331F350